LVLTLAVLAASASARTTSWNELFGANIFHENMDSPRSRSGHPAVLMNELSALLNDEQVLGQLYTKYTSLFDKNGLSARDLESGLTRQEIFKNKLVTIAEHNFQADAGVHTWIMGVNQFSDLTDEEFRKTYTPGLVNLTAFFENSGLPLMTLNLGQSPPASKDWVAEKRVSGVKDQGQCGSCYAFATCAALESAVAIKGNSATLLDLAEQEMVDCSQNNGCNGGFWYDSFDYMKSGIRNEADYKYTAKAGSCDNTKKSKASAASVKAYALTKENDDTAMRSAMNTYGPLAVAVTTENWSSYRSGVFSSCGTKGVDHAVLLTGYNANQYTIKNSWGAGWGESGYIRLARTATKPNPCRVAQYPCYVQSN